MTSRERVLRVLKHRFAGRVPVAEMWIDPGVARAVMPGARDGNDVAVRLDMVTAPPMIYGPDEIAWEERGREADVAAATERLLDGFCRRPAHPVLRQHDRRLGEAGELRRRGQDRPGVPAAWGLRDWDSCLEGAIQPIETARSAVSRSHGVSDKTHDREDIR